MHADKYLTVLGSDGTYVEKSVDMEHLYDLVLPTA